MFTLTTDLQVHQPVPQSGAQIEQWTINGLYGGEMKKFNDSGNKYRHFEEGIKSLTQNLLDALSDGNLE